MECLGAPLWIDEMGKSYGMFPDPDELQNLVQRAIQSHPETGDFTAFEILQDLLQQYYFQLTMYFFGTDKGGDQQGNDALIHVDFAVSLFDMQFRNWCLHHQSHLICKRQLERLDKYRHFSSLSKIVNVWRTSDNASKLKEHHATLFGRQRANIVTDSLLNE